MKILQSIILLGALSKLTLATWQANSTDCLSPKPSNRQLLMPDTVTKLAISSTVAAVPNDALCSGITYNIKLIFSEQRKFIATASQGNFDAAINTSCPNRYVGTTCVSSANLPYILPCTAAGVVNFTIASVPCGAMSSTAAGSSSYYQLVRPRLPVAGAESCWAKNKCSAGAAGVTGTSKLAPVLKLLNFPLPKITVPVFTAVDTNGSYTLKVTGSRTVNLTLPTIRSLSNLSNPSWGPGLLKLANLTLPNLGSLQSLSQAQCFQNQSVSEPGLTIDSQQQQPINKSFLRRVVVGELQAPKLSQMAAVRVKLSTADAATVRSLPSMADTLLSCLRRQIFDKAMLMEVDIVDTADGDSVQDIAATALNRQGGGSLASAASPGRRLSGLSSDSDLQDSVLTVTARTGTLFSDGFSLLYATMSVVSQAAVLLGSMAAGAATGSVTVDLAKFLAFCTNMSNLGGEISHLVGRILSINADALAPL